MKSRTLTQWIILSMLTVGAAGIELNASIVDTPEPIDQIIPTGNYSGYIPDGAIKQTTTGTVQIVHILKHKPSLNLHLNMAVFWPSGCGTVMGMVDNPCDSESTCKQACGDICTEATGYGVLEDVAPAEHLRPHEGNSNCTMCEWDCHTGGGSCAIQCCSSSSFRP